MRLSGAASAFLLVAGGVSAPAHASQHALRGACVRSGEALVPVTASASETHVDLGEPRFLSPQARLWLWAEGQGALTPLPTGPTWQPVTLGAGAGDRSGAWPSHWAAAAADGSRWVLSAGDAAVAERAFPLITLSPCTAGLLVEHGRFTAAFPPGWAIFNKAGSRSTGPTWAVTGPDGRAAVWLHISADGSDVPQSGPDAIRHVIEASSGPDVPDDAIVALDTPPPGARTAHMHTLPNGTVVVAVQFVGEDDAIEIALSLVCTVKAVCLEAITRVAGAP